jgi:hypothetical protein
MPILLLNKEGVAAEIMELARIKIATLLRVPIETVNARWEANEGRPPTPAFDVDIGQSKDLSEDKVRQSIGGVWRWLKDDLSERLKGLEQRRG